MPKVAAEPPAPQNQVEVAAGCADEDRQTSWDKPYGCRVCYNKAVQAFKAYESCVDTRCAKGNAEDYTNCMMGTTKSPMRVGCFKSGSRTGSVSCRLLAVKNGQCDPNTCSIAKVPSMTGASSMSGPDVQWPNGCMNFCKGRRYRYFGLEMWGGRPRCSCDNKYGEQGPCYGEESQCLGSASEKQGDSCSLSGGVVRKSDRILVYSVSSPQGTCLAEKQAYEAASKASDDCMKNIDVLKAPIYWDRQLKKWTDKQMTTALLEDKPAIKEVTMN